MGFGTMVIAVENWITLYLVQPLLIMLLGIFAGKLIEHTFLFIQAELRIRHQSYPIVTNLVTWSIYVLAAALALRSIHLLQPALWLLGGGALVIILTGLVLGIIDFIPNFWRYQAVKAAHRPGAEIKTRFVDGTVVQVRLADTHVRSKHGEELYLPNRSVVTRAVKKT